MSDPSTNQTGPMPQASAHNEPFVLYREDVPSYWQVDSLWSLLASGDTTAGALTIFDQVMPTRSGPPPHVHPRLHEYFYLLDGEIQYQLKDTTVTATPGAFISVPPGTIHAFAVKTPSARVLNLYTPGGFSEQISFLGTPATALRLPEPGDQVPAPNERKQAYGAVSAEINTQRWLGPDEARDLLAADRDAPHVT